MDSVSCLDFDHAKSSITTLLFTRSALLVKTTVLTFLHFKADTLASSQHFLRSLSNCHCPLSCNTYGHFNHCLLGSWVFRFGGLHMKMKILALVSEETNFKIAFLNS